MFKGFLERNLREAPEHFLNEKRFAGRDPGLWGQALHYLSSQGGSGDSIKEVLRHIEQNDLVPPLIILDTLKESKDVPISHMKKFVLNAFEKLHQSAEEARRNVAEDEKAIASMKEEIESLRSGKPKIFQSTRCFQCGLQLELPTVHFFSGHSYHSYCVPSDGKDPKCAEEDEQKRNLLLTRRNAASNPDEFFKFLRDSRDGFDAVSEYFGRGLFTPEGATEELLGMNEDEATPRVSAPGLF